MQLIVSVKKLNKRSSVPISLAEKNIIGTVLQGFHFEGEEITILPNPALGKWYKDRDGSCYWGGGLIIEPTRIITNISGLPVNLPQGCRLGIDISHHNELLDWAAIKTSGVSFVFIKISEGVGTPDNKAKEHANNAIKFGLRIGYYHFCRPDKRNGESVISDATAEAEEALQVIAGLQKPDLPLVLDLEDQKMWDAPLGKQDYFLWVTTFLKRIKEMASTDCILYSRKEYLDRKLPPDHNLGKYKIWVSYYPSKPDANNVLCPIGWKDWAIWQYTEKGIIGNSNNIDINILKDSTLFLT
jgi:GH25 family lysozyme M1 (1,4-beta-N-acetylmuramidase)